MRFKKTSSGCRVRPAGKLLTCLKPSAFIFSFLFLFLFLKVSEIPLKAEVDYFKQMGVLRPEKTTYAANFVLPDIHGNKIGLSKYQGVFVMLNFWATW